MSEVLTSEKPVSAMAKEVAGLVLFERAKEAIGARELGEIIGISRRAVYYKLENDIGLTKLEFSETAAYFEAKAAEYAKLAADLRRLIA